MSILNFIGDIFGPAAKLVDDLHTSGEEKIALKAKLLEIQTGVIIRSIELEKTALEAKTSIIVAEAKSGGWLTRSWRPMTMLALVASVLGYWFGLTPPGIPEAIVERMFSLVQLGVGGYIASRGAEKIVPKIVEVMKQKEQT